MSCKWCTNCDEKNKYNKKYYKYYKYGITRFKLDGIEKHAKSKSHKNAMKIVKKAEKKLLKIA
jgi:hypothetical protein